MLTFWQKKLSQQFKRNLLIGLLCVGIMCSMLLCSGFTVFTHRVTINDEGAVNSFVSLSDDSQEILEDAGYTISPNDEVITSRTGSQITITIHRALDVSLLFDGKEEQIQVRPGSTVANALSSATVTLGPNDLISCDPNTIVTDGMQIIIQRVTLSDRTMDEVIPYGQVRKETNALYQGQTRVESPGQNGVLTHHYQDTIVDGVVTATNEIGYTITTPAVDEVILVGTKQRVTQAPAKGVGKSQLTAPASLQLDSNGIPTNYKKVLTGRGCAYTGGSKTSTGKTPMPGYVAVNPNVIPYGTQMYIVSQDGYVYGYAIAADTGGSCMANDILVDLYMNSQQECKNFGSRTVNIYIL